MPNYDPRLVREYNSGSSVKSAARRLQPHGYSRADVVRAFRTFARDVGYSNHIPRESVSRRPYAEDWTKLDSGFWYSPKQKLYWDGKTCRNETTARWAGWIGNGAQLRSIIEDADTPRPSREQ